MSYSETDTVKWRRILTSDMISSDSSGIEDTVPVLVAKEIPWRSRKVSSFFEKLDKFYEESKSEQAKHQTKPRIRNGKLSTRVIPTDVPRWAIAS